MDSRHQRVKELAKYWPLLLTGNELHCIVSLTDNKLTNNNTLKIIQLRKETKNQTELKSVKLIRNYLYYPQCICNNYLITPS